MKSTIAFILASIAAIVLGLTLGFLGAFGIIPVEVPYILVLPIAAILAASFVRMRQAARQAAAAVK